MYICLYKISNTYILCFVYLHLWLELLKINSSLISVEESGFMEQSLIICGLN